METMTRVEIAKYLRVSERTINNLMRNEGLPHYRTGPNKGCRVLFPKKLVDEWQEKRVATQMAQHPSVMGPEIVRRRPRVQVA